MRRALIACVAGLLAAGLTFTAGCADSDPTRNTDGGAGQRDRPDAGAEADPGDTGSGDTGSGTDDTGTGDDAGEGEPDLVGKGLAIAEDRAEKAGYEVEAYDSSGRDRTPVLARSWQVCFQEEARTEDTGEIIRVGVVRTSESCPDEDGSRNRPELGPDKELPEFAGSSLQVATEALGDSASVNPVDARKDRDVYIPQNWKVCDQSPEPGSEWDGEPVTFRVVKYGERCP